MANKFLEHVHDYLDALQEITIDLFGDESRQKSMHYKVLEKTLNIAHFELFEICRELAIDYLDWYKPDMDQRFSFEDSILEFLERRGYIENKPDPELNGLPLSPIQKAKYILDGIIANPNWVGLEITLDGSNLMIPKENLSIIPTSSGKVQVYVKCPFIQFTFTADVLGDLMDCGQSKLRGVDLLKLDQAPVTLV